VAYIRQTYLGESTFRGGLPRPPLLDGKRPYDTVSVKDAYEAVVNYMNQFEVNT
jgi:hypothetical protein